MPKPVTKGFSSVKARISSSEPASPAPWLLVRDEPRGVRWAARLPLAGTAVAYGLGARLHRALYENRFISPRRLACRVISVGSLTAGGAGKTPVAAWLATRLRERGHRVALATRGYGRRRGKRNEVATLSDGRYVTGDVTALGDEPLVLAAHARHVPVLVGRNRGVVGLRAISAFGIDVLVLDDGFQHHRLARDLDIVVIDGSSGFGNRRILPAGPLREPASALARAHAIGIVDPPPEHLPEWSALESDLAYLDRHVANPFRFRAFRRPARVRSIAGYDTSGGSRGELPETLAGARIGVLSALGRPDALERTLGQLGATVIASRTFRDHHRYTARDLHDLHRHARIWVTSEKDAVKILPGWAARIDLRVLSIDLEVEEPAAFVEWVEERIATAVGDGSFASQLAFPR